MIKYMQNIHLEVCLKCRVLEESYAENSSQNP